ncbi:hypothetical protein QBC45DRAFT_221895 [Copromyces sp. CBS 386.78]|nr:hypothetical protein QBC45DRAFT_221895 [Copromyces sp. CBS 386.78]
MAMAMAMAMVMLLRANGDDENHNSFSGLVRHTHCASAANSFCLPYAPISVAKRPLAPTPSATFSPRNPLTQSPCSPSLFCPIGIRITVLLVSFSSNRERHDHNLRRPRRRTATVHQTSDPFRAATKDTVPALSTLLKPVNLSRPTTDLSPIGAKLQDKLSTNGRRLTGSEPRSPGPGWLACLEPPLVCVPPKCGTTTWARLG